MDITANSFKTTGQWPIDKHVFDKLFDQLENIGASPDSSKCAQTTEQESALPSCSSSQLNETNRSAGSAKSAQRANKEKDSFYAESVVLPNHS